MEHVLIPPDGALDAGASDRRDAKRRLAAAVRALAEQTHLVRAADVDADDVAELAAAVEAVNERLAALPSHRGRPVATLPTWEAVLAERSPISGRCNPLAPPLVLAADGDVVRGHATFGAAYEGPPGSVHGGHVAAAFDEVVGMAQALSGGAGMTGTLTVRMRRPTPLGTRIEYEGGVDRVEGRKIFVWARSHADGELLCEAESVMIVARGR